MKTDNKFDKLTPEQYTDDLGANYTRLQYLRDKVEESFKMSKEEEAEDPKFAESLTKMLDGDAHIEISYKGERLFIDAIKGFVSNNGVKKIVIYVTNKVNF